jgi:hypothetical protein
VEYALCKRVPAVLGGVVAVIEAVVWHRTALRRGKTDEHDNRQNLWKVELRLLSEWKNISDG